MDTRMKGIKDNPRAMRFYVYTLYEFVRETKPEKMLEIGVQAGQSTKTILCAMNENKKGTLVSIDIKSRGSILDCGFEDLKPYWHFIKGDSTSVGTIQAAYEALEEGQEYDMLFIDGSHVYEDAKQDFDNYTKLVKPGGIVMLHDTVNHRAGVNKLWEEITWREKFNLTWGRAHLSVVPGFGICRKPLN